MCLSIVVKPFSDLTNSELYELLRLRNDVFIVEQNCPYLDIDNRDQSCFHLLAYAGKGLVGYSRILPADLSYKEVSFGRVAVSSDYRGKGLGKQIVEESIKWCNSYFGSVPIKIGAQLYLLNFYESFGFVPIGQPYDEDGIMHIEMIKYA